MTKILDLPLVYTPIQIGGRIIDPLQGIGLRWRWPEVPAFDFVAHFPGDRVSSWWWRLGKQFACFRICLECDFDVCNWRCHMGRQKWFLAFFAVQIIQSSRTKGMEVLPGKSVGCFGMTWDLSETRKSQKMPNYTNTWSHQTGSFVWKSQENTQPQMRRIQKMMLPTNSNKQWSLGSLHREGERGRSEFF